MRNFNLRISCCLPFVQEYEQLVNGVVSYKVRVHGVGTTTGFQCDWLEIGEMLRNKKFFADMLWMQVEFDVYDERVGFHKKVHRRWRFVESGVGNHYWLDMDNEKWYQQDNWLDWKYSRSYYGDHPLYIDSGVIPPFQEYEQ